jgi:hypothetical protein
MQDLLPLSVHDEPSSLNEFDDARSLMTWLGAAAAMLLGFAISKMLLSRKRRLWRMNIK